MGSVIAPLMGSNTLAAGILAPFLRHTHPECAVTGMADQPRAVQCAFAATGTNGARSAPVLRICKRVTQVSA